jgi:hypothetical protein
MNVPRLLATVPTTTIALGDPARTAPPHNVNNLVTHHAPLQDAPRLYETFQKKEDGCIKVVLRPGAA